jgi:diguanylate cyclase (GGDEF)-like protein
MPETHSRGRLLRRAAPFLLAIGATFGLAALPPYPPNTTALLAAGVWTAFVVAAIALAPWHRLSPGLHPAAPLALLPGIALLNYADDRVVSTYAPVVVLPVVWIALFASRAVLLVALAAVAAMFLVPIAALGPTFYASEAWKLAILWIVTATVLGLATEGLVGRVRRRAVEESLRAEAQRRRAEQSRLLLDNARLLAATVDRPAARAAFCEAARAVAGATFSAFFQPDPSGTLILAASNGLADALPPIGPGTERAGAMAAFTSRRSLFVADAQGDPTGAASLYFEPVLDGEATLGVLVVGWDAPVAESATRADALGLIAVEAAMAFQRADLVERLESAARTDELTGLPNRRDWEDQVAKELARARRESSPICVAVLDLDFFKTLNDTRGHQAGDRLLRQVASAWRVALRATDLLARYGGEEFALALPACSLSDAVRLVERLRLLMPDDQTVSAGLAQWNGVETAEDLFKRADAALYDAKRAGKDCVTLAA